MHVERLKHLITILERVEAEHKTFDMSGWGTYDHKLNCQTSGCALGYACFDPVFQKEGLSYKFHVGEDDDGYEYEKKDFLPYFNKFYGFGAATKFFELDYYTSEFIFGNKLDDDTQRVIKRINQVLEGKV
jgi:hypothetical protein